MIKQNCGQIHKLLRRQFRVVSLSHRRRQTLQSGLESLNRTLSLGDYVFLRGLNIKKLLAAVINAET